MSRALRIAALALVALLATAATASAHHNARLPRIGASAKSVDLRAVPNKDRWGSRYAVKLEGRRPSWFTYELRRKVRMRAGVPVAAPKDAPLPGEVGIRPGSWMIGPAGCTMNFVFRKSDGTLAIGTAGHCVDKVGQHVTLLTLAPGTENPVLVDIGTVKAFHDNGIGDDFALVSIRPQLYSWVSPTAAVVGGPCGNYGGSSAQGVFHYGHGLAIGTGGTPRAGAALTWRRDAFGWAGASIFGDSGSAVRVTNFQAAGDLTHLVVDSRWLPSFVAGTRVAKMLRIAGSGWSVANSPLCL